MKPIGRAVQDDVWSKSLDRSSREIYAEDRKKQREASKKWSPKTLEIMAQRILEREEVGHNYLWGREAIEMIEQNLVKESDLDPHRNAYAHMLRATYSPNVADLMLLDMITKHEKLKEMT